MTIPRRPILALLAAALGATLGAAQAAPDATHVRVAKVYSTVDGRYQYVELEIVRVGDAPLSLDGRTMAVRDRRGATRSFPLIRPGDPPPPIQLRHYLLVTSVTDAWGPYADLWMPPILPIDGATIMIDGMDEFTYERLPEDGRSALARDGSVVPATFEKWGPVQIYDTQVAEFHHAALDHYFMTDRADEIALLESGAIPGWTPTGARFYAFTRPFAPPLAPACRYLLLRPGSYSHFFSLDGNECAALANAQGGILEAAAAFHAGVPDDGKCGNVTVRYVGGTSWAFPLSPVYRLWNGKPDAGHRYVTTLADRDAMIARGWVPEGSGPLGVGMCATLDDWHAYCVGFGGEGRQACIIDD